jgi:hypothetical protein
VILIVSIILAFLLIGTAPVWPHSVHWGYYPSGGFGILLAVFVIYILLSRA